MKKLLAILLVLTLLLPLGLTTKADAVEVKPYYGIGSSDFNRIKFPNLEGKQSINVTVEAGQVYFNYTGSGKDIEKMAASLQRTMDKLPEGLRHLLLFKSSNVFELNENVVFLDKGVGLLKERFTEFVKAYAALGGKLDSFFIDVEYVNTYSWYIYSREYYKDGKPNNLNIYKQIVEDPRYTTEIRPMLVERGFKFYENPTGNQSEIWSIYPYLKDADKEKYANSATIWDTVMRIRLNNYMTEALYEPLAEYLPGVPMCDYQSRITNAWHKDLSDSGEHKYVAGNSVPAGDYSHYNTYGCRLAGSFFEQDGVPLYQKPVAYNSADFEANPFNHFLWDINLMKNMYDAADGKICIEIAEYDYDADKKGTASNTPYYTETILHIGMLDPNPFLIYMYDKAFDSTAEYNARAKVFQEIFVELTRVAGYADRKPIEVPATWNSGFVLSGIYANGRNLWRLTPDTTDGMTLASFKTKDSDPTFSINGQTITFPQGKIITDGEITVVGTCGYWIETPKNVTPIVTTAANRYSEYPSFSEDFEGYEAGFILKDTTAKPAECWSVSGSQAVVQALGGNKALAITGTTAIANVKLPKNITAGDSYAKQQIWEVSVTLPQNLNADAEIKLLACGGDGGFKISGGKVFYDEKGNYQELSGVTLSPGQKYTLRRENDLRNADAFIAAYSVYDGAGKLIGKAENVPAKQFYIPVNSIQLACTNVTGQVLLDDYKLYPTGVAADFEVYNAKSGILQEDATKAADHNVAYRMSWLNGTDKTEIREVVATFYDAAGKQLSKQTVKKVEMKPGYDSVETGIVEVKAGQKVVLSLIGATESPPKPTQPTTNPTAAPTVQPTSTPTSVPTTEPTGEPSVEPTSVPTTAPAAAPTELPVETNATEALAAEKNGSGKTVLIVVIIVVAAGTVGATTAVFVKKKKQDEEH